MNTKDLANKKIWATRPKKNDPDAVKKAGRIHACVFHPSRAQLVGFLVKRPDVALMFRREDLFVAFNGFTVFDDYIVIKEDPASSGRGAIKALNIDLDQCVLWLGLPVMCPDGTSLGIADDVEFDDETGRVISLNVSGGATANALLGRRSIPGQMIAGFRRGMGAKLWLTDDDDDDPDALGAVIVAAEAAELPVEGGVAEKAGAATAVAADKVQKTYHKVKRKAQPAASEAAKTAGDAVQKGVYVTGRQIARTKGMFSNFRDEFKKAMNDDGEDKSSKSGEK